VNARPARAAVLRQDIYDVPPDASLTSPAGRCDPAFALVVLLGLFAEHYDPHRLRLARLAAETSRSTGRAQGAGARNFLPRGPAASLDFRRPRLLRHWAHDLGRDPRLGRRLDLMDQRWRSCGSDAQLGPRAAMARSRLGALNAMRTVALFLAYEFGFFVDRTLRRCGSCTRRTIRPKC
jgi:hypothetical protein